MTGPVHVIVEGASTPWWQFLVSSLGGGLTGGLISLVATSRERRGTASDRREEERVRYDRETADRLRDERRVVYADFVGAAHLCAHRLGKLARHDEHPDHALPSTDERQEIDYGVDVFAAGQVRRVQLLGSRAGGDAAQTVLASLYDFRRALLDALNRDDPVIYSSNPDDPYQQILAPYRRARGAFAAAVRIELGLDIDTAPGFS